MRFVLKTLFILSLFGCGNEVKKPIPRKPFYVTDKRFQGYKGVDCFYWVIDANGKELYFEDYCSKWHVADTIR